MVLVRNCSSRETTRNFEVIRNVYLVLIHKNVFQKEMLVKTIVVSQRLSSHLS